MANRNTPGKPLNDNSMGEAAAPTRRAASVLPRTETPDPQAGEVLEETLGFADQGLMQAADTPLMLETDDDEIGDDDTGAVAADLQRALPRQRPKRQEVFLPVHGFVSYFQEEMAVVDHPAFQRLGGLHQLGLAHLVYRGATHRRLEHALGTVHAAQCMIEALINNCTVPSESLEKDEWDMGCPLTTFERRFIRLAALLHDIGHVPFGHTFEDELNLLNKHDQQERLDKVFSKKRWYNETIPLSLEELIDNLYREFMPMGIPDRPSDLVKRIILYKPPDFYDGDAQVVKDMQLHGGDAATSEEDLASRGLRIAICGDIVGNTICADLLDYIYRDWYHLGRPRPTADRIYQYMAIRIPRKECNLGYRGFPLPTSHDRFVVSLGNASKFRSDGVTAIIDLLESRYELAEAVIFHRTKMAATAMMERALSLALPQANRTKQTALHSTFRLKLEDWLIDHAEEELLPALIDGREPFDGADLTEEEKQGLKPAQIIASKLLRRHLYDRLLTFSGRHTTVERIQELYGDSEEAAVNRANVLRRLEDDFKLPSGSVAMYCPDSRMNKKVAKVRVFVEGRVVRIDKYENIPEKALSRGHLSAQLKRFDDLWRVVFFVDHDVFESQPEEFWSLLRNCIHWSVFLNYREDETMEGQTRRLAQQAVSLPSFHLHGKRVLSIQEHQEQSHKLLFARQDATLGRKKASGTERYPTNAPSLLSFIAQDDAG